MDSLGGPSVGHMGNLITIVCAPWPYVKRWE